MAEPRDAPHLPRVAPIDGYGKGGFQFAGMSHRGSLLCLPSGIWAWPVSDPRAIDAGALQRIFAESGAIDMLLVGTGPDLYLLPEPLRWQLRDARIVTEVMATGSAVRTYNILVGECRRVAAGLIAVE